MAGLRLTVKYFYFFIRFLFVQVNKGVIHSRDSARIFEATRTKPRRRIYIIYISIIISMNACISLD